MPGSLGTGPFQNFIYNPPLGRDFRTAINSQAWVTGAPQLVISNYLKATKFLGYAALNPSATALVATKFLGFAVLNPSATALVASKFLGYAVLQPSPLAIGRTDYMWPNPRGPTFPIQLRGFVQGSPVNLGIPVAPTPPIAQYDWPNPRAPRRAPFDWTLGLNPNLGPPPSVPPPINQHDFPNPRGARRVPPDWQHGLNPNLPQSPFPPINQHDFPNPRGPRQPRQPEPPPFFLGLQSQIKPVLFTVM